MLSIDKIDLKKYNREMRIHNFSIRQKIARTVYFHRHESYEFHYLADGACLFDIDQAEYRVTAGTFWVIFPGERHRLRMKKRHTVTKYSFKCNLGRDEREYRDLWDTQFHRRRFHRIGGNHRFFFEDIWRKSELTDPLQHRAAEHRLLAFLYELFASSRRTPFPKQDRYMELALKIMQRHVRGDLDLQGIADRLELSPAYFIRLFKQRMGLPPMKYFTRLKIDLAAVLLRESDLPVKTVAFRLGFDDEFYFSRTFRRWIGISPTEFRERPEG